MPVVASPLVLVADEFESAAQDGGMMTMNFDDQFIVKSPVSAVQRYGSRRNPQSVLITMKDGSVITVTRGDRPTTAHYTATKANGETFEAVMETESMGRIEKDGTRTDYDIMNVAAIVGAVFGFLAIASLIFG